MTKMKTETLTNSVLATKWKELYSLKSSLKALRITAECTPDLFVGFDQHYNRCLILHTGKNAVKFRAEAKEHLSVDYLEKENQVVIRLLNGFFNDLFDDLIISIYNKISDIPDSKECLTEFLNTYYKWTVFFERGSADRLSETTIIGIIGELIVLKQLIVEGEEYGDINELLCGWTGPYDKGHDFTLSQRDLEVKALLLPAIDITISSEHQLEADPGKDLRLTVVELTRDYVEGQSLKSYVNAIQSEVIRRRGDITIVMQALRQKGIQLANLHEYDNFKYSYGRIITYDCMQPDFPRVVRSELPPSVHNVKYNLRLPALKQFILNS